MECDECFGECFRIFIARFCEIIRVPFNNAYVHFINFIKEFWKMGCKIFFPTILLGLAHSPLVLIELLRKCEITACAADGFCNDVKQEVRGVGDDFFEYIIVIMIMVAFIEVQ